MSWKLLTRLASTTVGRPATLTVLFFHRVFAATDPMMPGDPTAESFDRMLGWLQSQFRIIGLAEGVQRLGDGTLPAGCAAVTFDDGYHDNLEIAAPLLQRRGIPATFFIASSFLGGGIMFNDVVIEAVRRSPRDSVSVPEIDLPSLSLESWSSRRAAAGAILRAIKYKRPEERGRLAAMVAKRCGVDPPTDLMLTLDGLRALAAQDGFEVGAHTHSHPILTSVTNEEARGEIVMGRDRLCELLDRDVHLFAFPNGRWRRDFDERHVRMAREAGFSAAFSTEPQVCRSSDDCWALPRIGSPAGSEFTFKLRMFKRQFERSPTPQTAMRDALPADSTIRNIANDRAL